MSISTVPTNSTPQTPRRPLPRKPRLPARPPTPLNVRPRLDAIDLLRGLVMAVMVLDHVRDFVAGGAMNPRDVHDPALFLTRWVTHFCAPVFVLLAGVSASLYAGRGRSRGDVALFLLSRGLWLVLLELTVVRFGWTFSLAPDFVVLQVIWAIGVSMIVLAGLVFLPRGVIAALALVVLAGHNLLDGVTADRFGPAGWVWNVLHQPALLSPRSGVTVLPLYSLIPWVAVMAAGYALGPVFRGEPEDRRTALLSIGATVTVAFILLRAINAYGDPTPWSSQGAFVPTLLSFLNCEKYPPSLLYLCMTLGPALMLLAVADGLRGRVATALITLGRVPLAFYVAHVFLVHAIAVFLWGAATGDVRWLFAGLPISDPPESGFGLPAVYATWVLALAILYPVCHWFAGVKQRRREWWLSYL